jgi:hypothetical protein
MKTDFDKLKEIYQNAGVDIIIKPYDDEGSICLHLIQDDKKNNRSDRI